MAEQRNFVEQSGRPEIRVSCRGKSVEKNRVRFADKLRQAGHGIAEGQGQHNFTDVVIGELQAMKTRRQFRPGVL